MTDRRDLATRIWLAISHELGWTLTDKTTLDAVIAAAENELPDASSGPSPTGERPTADALEIANTLRLAMDGQLLLKPWQTVPVARAMDNYAAAREAARTREIVAWLRDERTAWQVTTYANRLQANVPGDERQQRQRVHAVWRSYCALADAIEQTNGNK